jgi:hypothetical protein
MTLLRFLKPNPTDTSKYDAHMKTYDPRAPKEWHMKAAQLAANIGGPLHDNLAHLHYKDGGGKRSQWVAWHNRHKPRTT